MTKKTDQDGLPGVDQGASTALGFGGKRMPRRLHRGDEFYLLLHCEVSSEGEKEDALGNVSYSAGARTTILAELDASEATKIAAAHGWEPPADDEAE